MSMTVVADVRPPVRLAVREDEQCIVDMVKRVHEESALRSTTGDLLPLDPVRVREAVQRAIIPNRNGNELPAWIGVIGRHRELHGSVYLSMEQTWYSSEPIVAELWNYLLPEHRKSGNARALIEFAKESAKAAKCTLVMGIMTAGREEAKARFYRRQLGNPVGAFFAWSEAH